ncbi:hypothetical protein H8356DRAFT_1682298 [Neocallimastix lanati (nom. inval.)]|jgi:hypothetical protein|nr:hypothetical protein H8356DRAFT_1682298 [Neocallimastix sp. JGI-2020a]
MKLHFFFLIVLISLISNNLINAKCINPKKKKIIKIKKNNSYKNEINYHFASANETAALLLSNRDYYDNLNQQDLDFRVQKVNATLEELEEIVINEVRDFTEEEKSAINNAISVFLKNCNDRSYRLPHLNDIVFGKTTTVEECRQGAYTHGNQIYLGPDVLSIATEDYEYDVFNYVIGHELFHCFTRNFPDFRKSMYNIIDFTIVDQDFVFPKEIADRIISNPDVEHHNSYATFEINGEKKKCVVVLSTTKHFEEEGERFSSEEIQLVGLVPIDDLHTIYPIEEASNFYEVFGENTSYIIDPEETLADNFSFTIIYGLDNNYKTQRIIDNIDTLLKSYKP